MYVRPFKHTYPFLILSSIFYFYFISPFGALICIFSIDLSFILLILFKVVSRMLLKPPNEFLILYVLLFSSRVFFWSFFL